MPRVPRPRIPKRKVPFGARKGGRIKPERKPVKPKVPGTRDRMRPPKATTDPKIKRRTMREV